LTLAARAAAVKPQELRGCDSKLPIIGSRASAIAEALEAEKTSRLHERSVNGVIRSLVSDKPRDRTQAQAVDIIFKALDV